jgi:hypothetical protein
MAQAGRAVPAAAGFGAVASSGAGPIAMSITAQPRPVHCGQAHSTHGPENRNRRSG